MNTEATLTYAQKYYREKKEYFQNYYKRPEVKQRKYMRQKQWCKKTRMDALAKVGRGSVKCVHCGCDYVPFLEINHKNGGGTKEKRRPDRAAQMFYVAIAKGERTIDDLEILCRICNHLHFLQQTRNPFEASRFKITWEPKKVFTA